jgi:hypothetical protein
MQARKRCRKTSSKDMAPARSCTLAAVTTTVRSSPRVSTRMGRLRPLTCLGLSSPWLPCFGGLHGLTIDDPGARLAPLPSNPPDITAELVMHQLDDLPGREIMGQQAPGTAPRRIWKMASRISRLGYFSGRPPGLAAGTQGAINAHSLSVRPVGYGFRGAMPPMVTPRLDDCKLLKHSFSSQCPDQQLL